MATKQKPSVGRIVHYVSHGSPLLADGTQKYHSVCRAAIVTGVDRRYEDDDPQRVSLAVLNPTGMFFDTEVLEDDTAAMGGTWHWPERVNS